MSWLKSALERYAKFLAEQRAFASKRPFGDSTPAFSPRAQSVLGLARKEAIRLKHNFVGTEHVLIGLIRHGHGVAVNTLKRKGLDLQKICRTTEEYVGYGQEILSEDAMIPFTPRMKTVLKIAAEEMQSLHHTYLGTEHFLLGLLHETEGVAARVLKEFNVEIKQTRNEILEELDPNVGLQDGGEPEH